MDLRPGDIPSISTLIDRHNDLGKAILKALRGPLDEIDRDRIHWVGEGSGTNSRAAIDSAQLAARLKRLGH